MVKKFFYLFTLSLTVCFLLQVSSHAQEQYKDVVYLKNGSVVKGQIIENIFNDKIKIQTSDGSIFVYKYTEIEKITKEKSVDDNAKKTELNLARYNAEKKSQSTGCLWGFLLPGGQHFYVENYLTGALYAASEVGLYFTSVIFADNDIVFASTFGLFVAIRLVDIIHGIISIDNYNKALLKKYSLDVSMNNVELNFYTKPVYNITYNTLYDTTYNIALSYKF
jgi:sRNA-binding regulator protein Hfq